MSSFPFFNNRKEQKQAGFTMLEMIVVVAIVLIMSGIVIGYVPSFKDRSSLDLVAQEIAINVRSAQAFASSGRTGAGAVERKFESGVVPSYGVRFEAGYEMITLFADLDGNSEYTNDDERVEDYKLEGITLSNIESIKSNNTDNVSHINVIYKRPSLEAKFYKDQIEDEDGQGFDSVKITITGARNGKSKIIKIHNNGQISVGS